MGRINLILSVNSLVFAFTTGSPALFAMLVSVTGFCYGSIAVLAAAVNVDMFGVKYIATNDGIFDFSNAVGSLVFVFVLVTLFPVDDSDREEGVDDDDALGCSGAHCFQKVFFGAFEFVAPQETEGISKSVLRFSIISIFNIHINS